MNPRTRRLTVESEALRALFVGHPHVVVQPVGWHPAEQYRVTYKVPGVTLDGAGQPQIIDHHVAVLSAGERYPREKPYAVMETAIFHPNFGPNIGDEVCVGDDWTAAQTLADTIVKIGEMIQFQVYNARSPQNAVAARWVAENEQIFPIGRIGLEQAEPEVVLATPNPPDDQVEAGDG